MRIERSRGCFLAGFLAFAAAIASAVSLASCAQQVTISAPRYALVYGVRDYPGSLLDLSFTVNDADSIAELLASQGWVVRESTDSQATKAKIRADIEALASLSSDATILIYFSGHGTYIDPNAAGFSGYQGSYIVPYDAVLAGSNYLEPEKAPYLISPSDLNAWLSGAASKNVIVLLDCCNSAGFAPAGSSIDASPQDYSQRPSYSAFATAVAHFGELLVSNAAASGQKAPIVISAAGIDESSYDGSDGSLGSIVMNHGVFTYYLLNAGAEGDLNGDGVVTVTEAYAYTEKSIKAWYSGLTDAQINFFGFNAFLPHLSGGARDLVLFD